MFQTFVWKEIPRDSLLSAKESGVNER